MGSVKAVFCQRRLNEIQATAVFNIRGMRLKFLDRSKGFNSGEFFERWVVKCKEHQMHLIAVCVLDSCS